MSRPRSLIRALLHPVRATVEKYIYGSVEPVELADLAAELGLAPRLARYHVEVLAMCGLVAVDGAGRVSGQ